ncbi:MAG: hypothetical protein IPL62_19435 [Caulobacteraceae bacterium]|nr:hypothetical protein [Caulobacteraceae bacterium]
MSEKKRLNRRSFMGRILGATVIGGSLAALTGCATAEGGGGVYTGATDADSGSYADRAGYGRSGLSDSDTGPYADPAGRGRGVQAGITDNDQGPMPIPPDVAVDQVASPTMTLAPTPILAAGPRRPHWHDR